MQQSAQALAKVEFGNYRDPELVVQEAAHIARVFQNKMMSINDSKGHPILFRMFGPSRHITKPGWQLLGSMFRVTAGIVPGSCKFLDLGNNIMGWEATAEAIYVPNGHRISTADSMCLTDEPNWDSRPEYEWVIGANNKNVKRATGEVTQVPMFQLRSMAQTRACSKVMSNLFAFVAIMAGCSGTAAEEVQPEDPGGSQQGTQTTQAPQRQNGGPTIGEGQVGRLFSLNKKAGRSREGLGVILAAHGYTAPSNSDNPVEAAAYLVLKGDFDKIQEDVLKPA